MDKSCRILVVDDYAAMSRMLRRILQEIGFKEIDLATDGSAALDKLRHGQYGLVFSDLNMEPMSGLEFLREVRRSPTLKSLPFIMITGTATSEQVFDAREAGATDYIVKPFTIDIVRKKLAAVLDQPRPTTQPT